MNTNSMIQQQQTTNLSPSALEAYFEHLFLNTPVIDRSKAYAVITFGRSARSQIDMSKYTAPDSNDMALIFAMQSWFYRRFRLHSLSTKCLETSRKLLSNSYDRVLTNFSVACAYLYIAMCLLDENDSSRSLFYLENVEAYLERCKQKTQQRLTIDGQLQILRERFLEMNFLTWKEFLTGKEVNLAHGLKRFMYINFIAKQYRRLNLMKEERQSGISLDNTNILDEFDEFIPYLKQIKGDLEHDNEGGEQFRMDLDVIDRIASKFAASTSSTSGQLPEMLLSTRKLAVLFVTQGAKIQYLQKLGRHTDPLTRQVADYITSLCDNPVFIFSYPLRAYPLTLAIKVHIQCLQVSTDPQDCMRLVELLKADVKAMYVLANGSKIILPLYESVIRSAEQAIQKQEEKQRQNVIYSSLQSIISDSVSANNMTTSIFMASLKTSSDQAGVYSDDLELFLSEFLNEEGQIEKESRIDRSATPSDQILFW